MPHGKIQGVVTAKTAAGDRDLRSPVFPLQVAHKLVEDVAFVLHMPPDPRSGMHVFVAPALAVDAVHTEYLDLAAFQFSGQGTNHPGIFILKKTSHGGWKNQDRLTGVAVDKRLHVAAQFVTIFFPIFAVHVREDCNRSASSMAVLAEKTRSQANVLLLYSALAL